MSHLFQDQTAVITGAGGVLCSEIAVKLAAEGAKTVLVGRTEEKLKKVEAQILAAGGACMVRTADVTDEAAMEALADEVERTCGPCRYLINGAGGNNNKAITTNFTYEPEELVGKTLIAITNLPPRKMMGIDSCGMIISAVHHEEGVEKLHCLMVDDHIPAGAKLY